MSILVAEKILASQLPRLGGTPQSNVVVDATRREIVSRLIALARIQPVHETGCLIPTDARSGHRGAVSAVGRHVNHVDLQPISGLVIRVVLRDHVPAEFVLPQLVRVRHRTGRV